MLSKSEYQDALRRYEDALGLCVDVPVVLHRILYDITDIARMLPEHCRLVGELHQRVPFSRDTEYLRTSARLSYVCSSREEHQVKLSQLVEELSRVSYGRAASLMEPFVGRREEASLYQWTGERSKHVHSLRRATRELCATDERISLAVNSITRTGVGQANALSILGFWTLQPAKTLDDDTRSCLARVATELESHAGEFGMDVGRDVSGWLQRFHGMVPEGGASRSAP